MFSQIDADALIQIWPSIKNTLHGKYTIRIDTNVPVSTNNSDVLGLLKLVKFVRMPNSRFLTTVKALIVFSEVLWLMKSYQTLDILFLFCIGPKCRPGQTCPTKKSTPDHYLYHRKKLRRSRKWEHQILHRLARSCIQCKNLF